METLSDSDLLRRWATDRDEPSFAEIVRRHSGLVQGICRRTLDDRDLAADAAQAVFLLLSQKAARVPAEPSLSGWLFVAARNAARNLKREEDRRRAREWRAFLMTDPADPLAAVDPRLDDALAALSDGDRSAILLRFAEDRSLADVGTALGIAENAARMRVARALDKLRRRLGPAACAVPLLDFESALRGSLRPDLPPLTFAPTAPAAALAAKTLLIMNIATSAKIAAVGALALLAVFGGRAAVAAFREPAEAKVSTKAFDGAFARLAGRYQGQLTYIDGVTGRRSSVPSRMVIRSVASRNVAVDVTFPGSPDYDSSLTIALDRNGRITKRENGPADAVTEAGMESFALGRSNEFELRWRGRVGREDATFRHSVALEGGKIVRREQTKTAEGPWTLQFESTMERVR